MQHLLPRCCHHRVHHRVGQKPRTALLHSVQPPLCPLLRLVRIHIRLLAQLVILLSWRYHALRQRHICSSKPLHISADTRHDTSVRDVTVHNGINSDTTSGTWQCGRRSPSSGSLSAAQSSSTTSNSSGWEICVWCTNVDMAYVVPAVAADADQASREVKPLPQWWPAACRAAAELTSSEVGSATVANRRAVASGPV